MQTLRILRTGNYDDRGYSNEESIANLLLTKPESINNFLTYNYGKDDDRFPLTFLTEGRGKKGSVEVTGGQWTWKTMGRAKTSDCVSYFNTANTTPGKGGAEFEVHFSTHFLIEQYTVMAPDGVTQVRIQKDLGESPYGFAYIFKLLSSSPDDYVDLDMLSIGKYWSLGAPIVSESYSKGNRSNSMGPGKMTSQLEIYRFSKEIGGNLANVVTEYEFADAKTGENKKLWINEEMRQFNITMRIAIEERLWTAEYNRNANGEILLTDRDNGKPVPTTAGMLQICRESNYDTYGEYLTVNKLKKTIGDILDRETDTGTMEIVLMAGKGFIEDFDDAMKMDARDNGFVTPLGDKMINGADQSLIYGAYFRQYKTVEGHIITVKHCAFFDNSTIAETATKNGNVHPRSGRPMTSHQACFIDFSTYNGVQNVRIVNQKGQKYKAKVVKGMADVPPSWTTTQSPFVANDIDASRYEVKHTLGLQVDKATKMFMIGCVL